MKRVAFYVPRGSWGSVAAVSRASKDPVNLNTLIVFVGVPDVVFPQLQVGSGRMKPYRGQMTIFPIQLFSFWSFIFSRTKVPAAEIVTIELPSKLIESIPYSPGNAPCRTFAKATTAQ